MATLHGGFCLAEVSVLPQQGFIVVRGEHRHVSSKALELLLQLALHAETIVSQQQLLSAVWGDVGAAKVNLTHAISELRHVLGDNKACPIFIQTLPRRGYRLLLPVRPLASATTFIPQVERRGRGNAATAKHRSWLMSLFRGSRLFSVSVAFLVSVWLFIQVMAITFPLMNISATGMKLTLLVLLVVFPLVLLVTWVGDLRERKKRLSQSDNPDKQRYWRRQLTIELVFLLLSFTAVGLLAHSLKLAIDADSGADGPVSIAAVDTTPIPNSVAVLPFLLSNGSSIEDYLIDGIRQELLYSLTQLNQFPVLADRAMQANFATASYAELAAHLRVEFILEASLSADQDTMQLEVSIVEASTGVRRWSNRLSQSRQALPLLQQDLHRQVQNAFALIMPVSGEALPTAEYRITENFVAFDAYMQARQRLKKYDDMQSLQSAENLLLKALQADPHFALASASLCKVHLDMYVLSRSVSEFELAQQACQHAASLNVDQAGVATILGDLYRISGQHTAAMARYDQALALNARWVDALSGKAMVLNAQGNKADAEQQFRLAIELEPGYWQNYMLYGSFLYETGSFDAAARHFERAAQLKPASTDVLNSLAAAWFFSGQFQQAITAWQQVVELAPMALSYSNLGTAYYFNADYVQAEQKYRQALDNSADDYTIWTNLADVLDVQAERQHEALPLYEKALQLAQNNLVVDAQAQALLSQISRLQSEVQHCDAALHTEQQVQAASQTDFYLFYDLAIASFNCQRHDAGSAYVNQAISYGYPAQLIAADPKIPHTWQ
ncbi:winged helix-turn-helix domain-containing protein [Rheinheimera maricola]|uniref:Winged helix-turn-helix domain-containing protein n=1 Tax=Rheinheimera maricola TaxID=2793282 RepID=A0ABS7X8L3_9GAMM|nr:winged helix-turn-helix domain-containing protein [Rheinheimera maricola]MBZ9611460.1 winged helix-turn-helix domain-containing protein [Rheinheimera maricola]